MNKLNSKGFTVRRMVELAILAALGVVLAVLISFPIFPAPMDFLKYDPADIPIIIATFAYGPVAGLAVTIVVSVVQGFTVAATSGILGVVMHILATGSYVLAAGLIYRRHRTKKRALAALAAGTLVMCVTMCIWNILITPLYMNMPREAVMPLILPFILPFNLIKAGGNSIIVFLVYKHVKTLIARFE